MLEDLIDTIAYEPAEVIKLFLGIIFIIFIVIALWNYEIAPMGHHNIPVINASPSIRPTIVPIVSITPTPLPSNTVLEMAFGDPQLYGAAGLHSQLSGLINKETPAIYAGDLYGYDKQGDPKVMSQDLPAYISNGYYTAQGYYNSSIGIFVYYFKDKVLKTIAIPTIEPGQLEQIKNHDYSLTNETQTIDDIVYEKDSNGYWVQVTNNTLQPVAIYTIVESATNAGQLNIDWNRNQGD